MPNASRSVYKTLICVFATFPSLVLMACTADYTASVLLLVQLTLQGRVLAQLIMQLQYAQLIL